MPWKSEIVNNITEYWQIIKRWVKLSRCCFRRMPYRLAQTSPATWHQSSPCRRWLMTTLWRHFRYPLQLRRRSSTCGRPLPVPTISRPIAASTRSLDKTDTVFQLNSSTADELSRAGMSVDTEVRLLTVMTGAFRRTPATTLSSSTSVGSAVTPSRRHGIVGGLPATTRTGMLPRLRPRPAAGWSPSVQLRRRRHLTTCVTASISGHLLIPRSPTPTH